MRRFIAGAIMGATLTTSAAAVAHDHINRHTVRAEHGDRVRVVLPHGTHEDICWDFRGRGHRRPVMVLFVGQHGTECHKAFTSAPEPREATR